MNKEIIEPGKLLQFGNPYCAFCGKIMRFGKHVLYCRCVVKCTRCFEHVLCRKVLDILRAEVCDGTCYMGKARDSASQLKLIPPSQVFVEVKQFGNTCFLGEKPPKLCIPESKGTRSRSPDLIPYDT
jgi:hypothetical protein